MKTLVVAALLAAAASAQAGNLVVSVTDRDGKPAVDVVVLVEAATPVAPVPAATPLTIVQQDLRFVPFLTVVAAGSTLRFVNRDGFDHHVRSGPSGPLGKQPPVTSFELRLDAGAPPPPANEYAVPPAARPKSGASSADVKVPTAGPIGLGCHIHGSMRGQVYVAGTAFFGKTDANGVVTIADVPAGDAAVVLWHADQLEDQKPLRMTLGAASAQANGQLNFTPRRRRN